ncbi:unnamed protein product [Rotaria sp. Silwood1]|nr:unnamed protein product [Rotaria sp. Silwood1]CAF1073876.1 unnamed protein product [Rotaria sp. Silwood1]CAF1080690.1 unnamed protein product [Rotaria sp. Silwood1]CAF3410859.1 unnamed protein product [Rotaria sp. Silwood1]CAF3438356.1 unnamed protein product [Rotaria sp. Silwood1]
MNSLLFRRVIQQHSSIRALNNISIRFTSSSTENKTPTDSSSIDPQFKKRIDDFIKSNKIAIFIKGEPNAPSCGFSKAVLQILNLHGCDFKSKNILDDQQLRETMKLYSNWPTFPQVYFNGEFVGGCDILLHMHQSGELVEELKKIGIQSKLSDVNKEATPSSPTN